MRNVGGFVGDAIRITYVRSMRSHVAALVSMVGVCQCERVSGRADVWCRWRTKVYATGAGRVVDLQRSRVLKSAISHIVHMNTLSV